MEVFNAIKDDPILLAAAVLDAAMKRREELGRKTGG